MMLVISAALIGDPTHGDPLQMEGLKLQLVAEKSGVHSDVPFAVGLRIQHATGFHTYWKNPGIAGVPTKLKWNLPDGFSAGEIEWPQPQLTKMAIYPVYGYEGEVLLPVTITPPANWKAADQTQIELEAEASWMCCAKTCHPGFATLKLTLPAGLPEEAVTDTKYKPLFDAARASQPIKTAAWSVSATRLGKTVVADVTPSRAGAHSDQPFRDRSDIYFFSGDGLVHSPAEQKLAPLRDTEVGFRLTLQVSEHAPAKVRGAARLVGVLTSKTPWIRNSAGNALEIDVPIATVDEPADPPLTPHRIKE